MIDSKWFWSRLQNDGLIVRMHIHTPPGQPAVTEARAYVCWVDDMFYNRGMVVFGHDDHKRHTSVKPLVVTTKHRTRLPLAQRLRLRRPVRTSPVKPLDLVNRSFGYGWNEVFAEWTADWPEAWRVPQDVVCSRGPSVDEVVLLSPRNPQALVQLARFQTAANFTHNPSWSITLGIVERRLGAIIRSNLRV